MEELRGHGIFADGQARAMSVGRLRVDLEILPAAMGNSPTRLPKSGGGSSELPREIKARLDEVADLGLEASEEATVKAVAEKVKNADWVYS